VSLDPPQVLVERSAIEALLHADHPRHGEVRDTYLQLVEQYRLEEILLVAVSDDLALVGRRWYERRTGDLAPVDALAVGKQHRRAAAQMLTEPHDPELALTLIMCERHKVRRVFTIDDRFAAYDVDLVPVGDADS